MRIAHGRWSALLRRSWFSTSIFCGVLLACFQAHADTQYIYDAAGRRVQAFFDDGSSVQYEYNAAGNLTSVTRLTSTGVAIANFSPMAGSPGTAVTIVGSGFSTTSAQNAVTFNGVSATVVSASVNALVVTVPAAATTGMISVATPSGSATSAQSFVVTAPLSISGFTPTIGASGTAVTITGTGFDTNSPNDQTYFNGTRASISSATGTQLQVTVPPGATSGQIAINTLAAQVVSAADFIVPPPGFAAADVVSTGRVTPGGAGQSVTVSASGKASMVLFEGAVSDRMTVVLTGVTMAGGTLTVYRPDGGSLASATIANNITLDLPTLPATGTYSIVLAPGNNTGTATVQVVRELNGVVPSNGTSMAVALTAGQNASFTFTTSSSQGFSLALTSLTTNPSGSNVAATVLKADGSTVANCGTYDATSGNCDFMTPSPGIYTLRLNPSGLNAASFNIVLSPDLSGTLTSGASPVTYSTAIPGQNMRYALSATAGQRGTFVFQNNAFSRGTIFIIKPDNSVLANTNNFNGASSGWLDVTFPTTGTYLAIVFVDYNYTGHIDLDFAPEVAGTVATDGTPDAVSLSPGQNAAYSFSGTAGATYGLALTNMASSPPGASVGFSLIKPDGSTFTSAWNCVAFSASGGNCDISALPVSGTYTVRLDPPGLTVMSFNLIVAQALSGGTLVADGATLSYTSSVPGQNSIYTFSGTSGQLLSLAWSNNTIPAGSFFVFSPSGSVAVNTSYGNNSSGTLVIPALPSTGIYQVVQFVDGVSTGHLDVKLQSR